MIETIIGIDAAVAPERTGIAIATRTAERSRGFRSSEVSHDSMIEVYPASWLISRKLSVAGYKRREGLEERRAILAALRNSGLSIDDEATVLAFPDALDATITVQLGIEFLQGRCVGPTDLPLAKKEGWIWIPSN